MMMIHLSSYSSSHLVFLSSLVHSSHLSSPISSSHFSVRPCRARDFVPGSSFSRRIGPAHSRPEEGCAGGGDVPSSGEWARLVRRKIAIQTPLLINLLITSSSTSAPDFQRVSAVQPQQTRAAPQVAVAQSPKGGWAVGTWVWLIVRSPQGIAGLHCASLHR